MLKCSLVLIKKPDNGPRIASRIHTMSRRALRTIDLLLVQVGFATPKKLEFSVFSVARCIESALDDRILSPDERKVIRWDKGKDFPLIGNQHMFTHVLLNLLQNAIYAVNSAEKGGIEISIEIGKADNRLFVKDTALGIPAQNLKHIFQPFYSTKPHGNGLGLAFCQVTMEKMGGRISCKSIEGEYAEFILILPKATGAT